MKSILIFASILQLSTTTLPLSVSYPGDLTSWLPSVGRFDHFELAGLHEGDILVNPLVDGINDIVDPLEKNAVVDPKYIWPGGVVYYEFSPEYSLFPIEKLLIKKVMKDIEKNSCVVFKERTDEYDYVKIVYDTYRCYSSVGRIGGEQILSLGMFCVVWWDKGNIYHELFHALGFYHEHTRPDRDQYITVHWDNIKSNMQKNFKKRQYTNTLELPYDINSVMHYSPHAFSKFFLIFPTLESKEKGIFFLRARSPSDLDYKKLNRLYNCVSGKRQSRQLYPFFPVRRRGDSRAKHLTSEAETKVKLEPHQLEDVLEDIYPYYDTSKSRVYNSIGPGQGHKQGYTGNSKNTKSWFDYIFG